MTVDKFGHYYNQKFTSEIKRKHFLKNFGVSLDGNNINIENKRIKNLASPLEGLDAVNKNYVNSQIRHMQEHIKRGIGEEVLIVRNEIKDLNKKIDDIYKVMITLSSSQYGKKSNSQ